MNPMDTFQAIQALLGQVASIGAPLQVALVGASLALVVVAFVPRLRPWRGLALGAMTALLMLGELLLGWLHWRLYDLAAVIDPATSRLTGHVAIPLWIESEKLYVWALIVAVMGCVMRRQRDEMLSGVMLGVASLTIGAAVLGKPFTMPVPSFLGQYYGYLQSMVVGGQQAAQAFNGMESARQFYYNAWFMWVHPPLMFLSYAAFVLSFVATVLMIARRHSSYETTAYRWARWGYLPLTLGMLLGFPWALSAWQGEAWWWSGKVNMSLMMWLLYTGYLHARLYLRRASMWKAVAALGVLSFVILVLTYIATYLVPGAHSYAGLVPALTDKFAAAVLGRGGV